MNYLLYATLMVQDVLCYADQLWYELVLVGR